MNLIIKLFCPLYGLALGAHAQQQLPDSCVHLNEVTVTGLTGEARYRTTPTPVTVIGKEYLNTRQFTNIIDAVAKQPGMSQITTGSGISKPVIRGLGYNRVLVVNDGIRQEGQQWGDEHGVEIDPQSVGSVEILKGPASLMYGSDAMAGVLLLHSRPAVPVGTKRIDLSTEYQSNNGLFDYSAAFAGNTGKFVYDARYSEKMAHDYKNKYDGYVANSRFHERAAEAMAGLNKDWGYSRLRLSYYHLTPGITEGERDEATGELIRPDNGKRYGRELPFQQIHHYKVASDNSFELGGGVLKLLVGYQQNRRQEFEESRYESGLDFMLHTVTYDARYVLREMNGWKVNVGLGGMYQQSLNKGTEYLIPAYRLYDIGAFSTVSKSVTERLHLSGGLRFDTRHLSSDALTDDGVERFAAFSRSFNGLTGSIGGVYNVAENLDVRLNVSRGYRVPNLSELGSNGRHEGTFRYERGNADLKAEYSLQGDVGVEYATKYLSLNLSLFANRINNYVYLQRQGKELVDDTPVYQYTAGDARILGGEAVVIVHFLNHLHWENSFSYVNSVQLHQPAESKYLPLTPAPRWLSTLHYDIPTRCKALGNTYVELEADYNLRQDHVLRAGDTETPTPAYALFNLSAGTDVLIKGKKRLSVYLTADNLLDKAYQNHLSRLKYADVNEVTGRTGVYNMGRNIGLKVLIPIML